MTSLWQQDGAPAYRARETVELLKEVTPDFIPPSLWPPNSPDLNPVNYAIWGIMQERVYNKGKIANVEELRQRIVPSRIWCQKLLKSDNYSSTYSQ